MRDGLKRGDDRELTIPSELYRKVREANPDDPCADDWEAIGAYLGDGVWGDPDHFGIQGEYEFAFRAYSSSRREA